MTMRHKAASFMVAGVIISLCFTVYLEIKDSYDLTETGTVEGKNVMQRLNDLNLIKGVNEIVEGFTSIVSPDNPLDMLGALATTGIGLLQTIGGIISFPFEMLAIIGDYYSLPGVLTLFLQGMVVLYVGFIILSAITRTDL